MPSVVQPIKSVVIIDDAVLMRSVLTRLIESDPRYEVVAVCENGLKALEVLKNGDPDIFLVDVEMPVMDGITFLRRARIMTRARIVVLSSATQIGTPAAHQARRLGADAILEKPSGAVSPDLVDKAGQHILKALAHVAA
jgi:two-component system, chemotaxis family, protein-glutamate methylesterase/glutaminase